MTLNSFGLRIVLTIVEEYGATTAGIVVTLRKIVSMLASYIIYPKPFGIWHGVGCALSIIGALLLERVERQREIIGEKRNHTPTITV